MKEINERYSEIKLIGLYYLAPFLTILFYLLFSIQLLNYDCIGCGRGCENMMVWCSKLCSCDSGSELELKCTFNDVYSNSSPFFLFVFPIIAYIIRYYVLIRIKVRDDIDATDNGYASILSRIIMMYISSIVIWNGLPILFNYFFSCSCGDAPAGFKIITIFLIVNFGLELGLIALSPYGFDDFFDLC